MNEGDGMMGGEGVGWDDGKIVHYVETIII